MIQTVAAPTYSVRQHRLAVAISALLVVLFSFLYTSILTQGMIGFGTLQSKLLIDRTGTANSSLLVASPSQSEALIVGTAPIVTNSPVSGTGEWGGTTHATLNANLTSMQGAASATAHFEWGYTAGTLTTSTAPQTLTGTGIFSANISGYNHSSKVFYRAVVESDGIRYSSPTSFIAASGAGGFILKQLFSLVIALGICLTSLKFAGANPVGVLISVLIGLVAFIFVVSVIT